MDLFEQVAKSMVDNQLLKYSAKEYFLKAGLCRMCMGDVSGAKVGTCCPDDPPGLRLKCYLAARAGLC